VSRGFTLGPSCLSNLEPAYLYPPLLLRNSGSGIGEHFGLLSSGWGCTRHCGRKTALRRWDLPMYGVSSPLPGVTEGDHVGLEGGGTASVVNDGPVRGAEPECQWVVSSPARPTACPTGCLRLPPW